MQFITNYSLSFLGTVVEFPANVSEDGIKVLFFNGIGLHVKAFGPILRFMIMIPQRLRGDNAGLLGRFNGDPTDDLWLSDGTTLPNNSPPETIDDEFGPSCKYLYNKSIDSSNMC